MLYSTAGVQNDDLVSSGGEPFSMQPFCLSWLSARFAKVKEANTAQLSFVEVFLQTITWNHFPSIPYTEIEIVSYHTHFLPRSWVPPTPRRSKS
jgi:hypothetical protein